MVLEFCAINKPEDWMDMVASQLGTEVKNDSFTIPASMGEGYIRQYYPVEWLTLTYVSFMTYEPLTMVRRSVDKSKWIPVMFYINEQKHEQFIGKSTKLVGVDTLDGIFMPSSHIPTEWTFEAKKHYENITLTFNKEWVEQMPLAHESYLGRLLQSGKSFYLFETITPIMHHTLDAIKHLVENEKPCSSSRLHDFESTCPVENRLKSRNIPICKAITPTLCTNIHCMSSLSFALSLHAKAIELLTMFVDKLEKRVEINAVSNLRMDDVESVFRVRRQILQSLSSMPNIAHLAGDVNMSVSKLQKIFKQVFGCTMAEYALSEKMKWAEQLLSTRLYSVSEVGYKVGYTNLSHFAEAFRRYYKINPKKYVDSL